MDSAQQQLQLQCQRAVTEPPRPPPRPRRCRRASSADAEVALSGGSFGQSRGQATAERRLTLAQIVRLNFVKYCQTTTLRGVPRIAKTKDRLLRHIWTAFVLAFFLCCAACLTLLVGQYLAYDVIHQPRTVRNHSVQFPSFTLCNTRPLSEEGIRYIRGRGLLLPKEFTSSITAAVKNTVANMKLPNAANTMCFNRTVKDAISSVFETKGFFENVPPAVEVTEFGHTLDQTVLICESTILIKDFRRSMPCDSIGQWTRTYDNKFLNCYTFTASRLFTKRMLTVRIMAFTNERTLPHCPDCSSFPATQVSGLRVQLHNAGNYPEVQEEGLNIRPGSLTEIRFDTKQWMMQEPPHGRCSERVPPVMRFGGSEFTYSYQACKKKILHEQIRQQCSCLDSTIPLPDTMAGSGQSYCGRAPRLQFSLLRNASLLASQSATPAGRLRAAEFYNVSRRAVKLPTFLNDADFQEFVRRVVCNMEIFKVAGKVTANQCFTPCTFYTYETTISTTNWPTAAYLFELVDDFKAMLDRIDRLHKFGQLQRNSSRLRPLLQKLQRLYGPAYQAARSDPGRAWRLLRGVDFVQRNFAEILINRGKSNFDIELIEEKPVISLTSLLSQVGGLLSIWVGLTFVCIVEIIEMLYNIAAMYTRQRKL